MPQAPTTENQSPPSTDAGRKNLLVIFGIIFVSIFVTGVGYYAGYSFTWQDYKQKPLIGAAPLKMKLVFVKREIAANQQIDYESVDERHEVLSNIAADAYGFTSEVMGRKAKWALKPGQYVSRHDVLPESNSAEAQSK
jgi:hypothetical protein